LSSSNLSFFLTCKNAPRSAKTAHRGAEQKPPHGAQKPRTVGQNNRSRHKLLSLWYSNGAPFFSAKNAEGAPTIFLRISLIQILKNAPRSAKTAHPGAEQKPPHGAQKPRTVGQNNRSRHKLLSLWCSNGAPFFSAKNAEGAPTIFLRISLIQIQMQPAFHYQFNNWHFTSSP